MLEIIGWFAALLIGLSLGLIGAGGSILTVPVLVYFMNIPPVVATAYSLFVVGLTALAGSVRLVAEGKIRLRLALIFSIPSLIAVYATRAFLVPAIPEVITDLGFIILTRDNLILFLFALFMIAAAVSMIRNGKQTKPVNGQFSPVIIAVEGFLVGILTGMVGAGGGFLIIPVLVLAAGLSMTEAVGTSLVIIAIKSLIGFTGDLGHIDIDWGFLALFSVLPLIGLFTGQQLAKKISGDSLKKGFGWFVLITGTAMVIKELFFSQ